MSAAFIQAKNINFNYQEKKVLDSITFSLTRADILAITGPSGCGKSTLLKIMANVIQPSSGDISCQATRCAYVSQEDGLLHWKNIFQNVALSYDLTGEKLSKKSVSAINKAIELMGLTEFRDYYPYQLSGGMKKRVELARALAYQPDLLLLDEPFSALDVLTRERLNILCKVINRTNQLTIIFVTHSMEEAIFLANQVIVLSKSPSHILHHGFVQQDLHSHTDYTLSDDQQYHVKELRKLLTSELTVSGDQQNKVSHNSTKYPKRKISCLNLLSLLFFLLLITLIKKLASIPDYLMPYPFDIFNIFCKTLLSGLILKDILYTLTESILGFLTAVITAMPLAYFFSKSKKIQELMMPTIIITSSIPIITVAPFFLLWLGIGLATKIIIVFLIIFFPLFITTMQSFNNARVKIASQQNFYKPTLYHLFTKLELPTALPQLFAGLKVALSGSIMGAVVSEFVSGSNGLGSKIIIAKASFDTPMMFVSLSWIIILTLSYYNIALSIEKKVLRHLLYA